MKARGMHVFGDGAFKMAAVKTRKIAYFMVKRAIRDTACPKCGRSSGQSFLETIIWSVQES